MTNLYNWLTEPVPRASATFGTDFLSFFLLLQDCGSHVIGCFLTITVHDDQTEKVFKHIKMALKCVGSVPNNWSDMICCNLQVTRGGVPEAKTMEVTIGAFQFLFRRTLLHTPCSGVAIPLPMSRRVILWMKLLTPVQNFNAVRKCDFTVSLFYSFGSRRHKWTDDSITVMLAYIDASRLPTHHTCMDVQNMKTDVYFSHRLRYN